MKKKTISFLSFVAISFWPILFYLWLSISSFIDGLGLDKYMPKYQRSPFSYITEATIFFLFPIITIVISHYFFCRQKTWRQRFKSIYGVWVIILFLTGFRLFAGIGGINVALAEGGVSPVLIRYLHYSLASLIFVFLAHILILPWIYATVFILKIINRRFSIWIDDKTIKN